MAIPTHFNNNKQTPDYAATETLFTQRTSKQGKADGKGKSSQNNPSKGKDCPPPDCDPEVEKQVSEIKKYVKPMADKQCVNIPAEKWRTLEKIVQSMVQSEKIWVHDKEAMQDKIKQLELVNQKLKAMAEEKTKYVATNRKGEIRDDLKPPIQRNVREALFRTRKFVSEGQPIMDATAVVYRNLKGKLKLDMSEEDFCAIYHPYVQSCLSDRRQYVQTRCEIAAKGKFVLFYWANQQTMPSSYPFFFFKQ